MSYLCNNPADISYVFPSLDISNLPITNHRSSIVDAIQKNQVTIIFGDTGSGKTTQIPKYIYNADLNQNGVIAVTQPRRIAAISMAKRVAQEMRCGLGIEVGYEVRYESRFGASTKIKYMTDGILLNHCLSDHRLSDYNVIMIDEAHERTINTDVLLGLLKKIISKRKDIKVVITSATIQTEKFSNYFNDAPVIRFEGRLFPVEVKYSLNCIFYNEETIQIVKNIHSCNESGDILIFLPGQEDIEKCCDELKDIKNLVVFPLYSSMDIDSQQNVFKSVECGQRKVVVATNIAETTITIDGIKFVIDCGYVKQNIFDTCLGMEVLQEVRISQAQADQRKGRAGRTCDGTCYRLYEELTYCLMLEEAVPEIKRKNLCEIYLKIVAIGLDPMNFDFIDPPAQDRLMIAQSELLELDLLTDTNYLTEMGRSMSDLPVEPILGKVILSSSQYKCVKDIVTILTMMTEKKILKRIKNGILENERQKPFHHDYGDHITALNVYNDFVINDKSRNWCYEHFLNYDKLKQVDLAREQLLSIIHKKEIVLESLPPYSNRDPIRKAIIKGYYRNICYMVSKGKYIRYLDNQILYIHPSSCLFKNSPKLILYHDIMKTGKVYMHGIMKLDEKLLAEFPNEMKKINYRIVDTNVRRNFMDAFQ